MVEDIVITARSSPLRLRNDGGEQVVRLLLSVQPSEELRAAIPRTPGAESGGADVCLALDVSGSMQEIIAGEYERTGQTMVVDGQEKELVNPKAGVVTKLSSCISAIRPLLGLLREQDTLSVVTFSDNAHIVCERLTANQASTFQTALASLQAGGFTALGKGILQAVDVIGRGFGSKPKKIIVMTDGNPEREPLSVALQAGTTVAERGMTLDCLGFGNDFNFLFMQQVVTPSRGRSHLLKSQADAEQLFSSLLKKAQDVVATNLRLWLVFSPQVRVTEHYRGAPENLYLGKVRLPDPAREHTVSLGVLERNQRYDYYFLVTVPPQPSYQGNFRLMKAEVTYDIPALGRAAQSVAKNITIDFVADARQADARDSTVEKGFDRAEIKRLERECEEARRCDDQAGAVQRFLEIIQRYGRLGMAAEQKEIQQEPRAVPADR